MTMMSTSSRSFPSVLASPALHDLLGSLRERFGHKSWVDWPEEYRRGGVLIDRELEERSGCFEFVQWLLEEQLAAVKTYCEDRGVLLKGDIPILLSRDSADVWFRQEYFNLDVAAGAPPDMFSEVKADRTNHISDVFDKDVIKTG